MIGQEKVYNKLENLGISFEYDEHPPAPTIEEAMKYWKRENTSHCKNLFLRNHKGNRHYLALVNHTNNVKISLLEQKLKQGKLSFASEKRLDKYLGLKPGSVSPFGLVNDTNHHVHVFIDEELEKSANIAFHPNDNRATISLKYEDFKKFLESTANSYEFINLAE